MLVVGCSPCLFKAKAGAEAKGAAEGEGKGDGDGSSAQPEVPGARCVTGAGCVTGARSVTGARCRSVGTARAANTDADANRLVKTTAAPAPLSTPLPPPDTQHGDPGRDKGQEGTGGGEGGGEGGRATPRNSWHFFEEDYERKKVVEELVARRQMALYMRRGWEHDKRVLRMTVPVKRGSASRNILT